MWLLLELFSGKQAIQKQTNLDPKIVYVLKTLVRFEQVGA